MVTDGSDSPTLEDGQAKPEAGESSAAPAEEAVAPMPPDAGAPPQGGSGGDAVSEPPTRQPIASQKDDDASAIRTSTPPENEADDREANEAEKPKKTDPAQAFNRLKDKVSDLVTAVGRVDANLSQIGQFTHMVKEALGQDADDYRSEGQREVLKSLFRLHQAVYTCVTAQEAGIARTDGFVVNLLDLIEGELGRHQVTVIRPQPGEPVDLDYMETQRDEPARFWRKADTVARVLRCGFALQEHNAERVLQSALVDVYRKQR